MIAHWGGLIARLVEWIGRHRENPGLPLQVLAVWEEQAAASLSAKPIRSAFRMRFIPLHREIQEYSTEYDLNKKAKAAHKRHRSGGLC